MHVVNLLKFACKCPYSMHWIANNVDKSRIYYFGNLVRQFSLFFLGKRVKRIYQGLILLAKIVTNRTYFLI